MTTLLKASCNQLTVLLEYIDFEFEFKHWAGSMADVPRGIAQKFTIIIIT